MLNIQIPITPPHSHCLAQWFSNSSAHQNHVEDLNHSLLGLTPRISNLVTLRSGLRFCVFNHRPHLENHCSRQCFSPFFEIIISVRNIFTHFFFFFLAAPRSMRDLSSRSRPVPPAVEARRFNHWTAREVLDIFS